MLYPSKLDNILPAFAATGSNVNIKIPYWLNTAVGRNDYSQIQCIIRTATTNTEIVNKSITLSESNHYYDNDKKCYYLTITENKNRFTLGQHYKIQIACIDSSGTIGYYSNSGVSKYVKSPTLGVTHTSLREVVGTFSDNITHEKVYSYKFDLYNDLNQLIETSGEKIHNSSNDTNASGSQDVWEIQTSLDSDSNYKVQYSVITTSNFQKSTSLQSLTYYESIAPNLLECFLIATNNFDEAYNRIYLKRNKSSSDPKICGNFLLLRASSKDNYTQWEKLLDFQIYNWQYNDGKNAIFDIYNDYLIEQGISYRYAIQAYNNRNIYSTKMMNSNGPVYSDFEDIYLYDGERQLRLRYNAKVTSFKSNILESKLDTIGSKYPQFFRNGTVQYKEFGLSGLISMTQDAENTFTLGDIYYHPVPDWSYNDTELSSYNFQKEREFKLQVLSWLMNGKEKVLKAAEGNYIVRLMNTSLSPNDTLGRMLHSFTSTAYEVADYDFINLKKYNFIMQEPKYYRIKAKCDLTNATDVDNFTSLANEVKIDQCILYTNPNLKMNCMSKTSTTSIQTGQYGIKDLTSIISESGLKEFNTLQQKQGNSWVNISSWPAQSYIEYSYISKCEDTTNWYYVKSITEPQSKTFTDIAGQGIKVSMKNYLSSVNTSNSITKNVISHLPYISVSKKSNLTNYPDGYYVIVKNEKDATNLFNLSGSKIYRNLEDCSLGEGLKATIICPVKTIIVKPSKINGGVMYAI